MADPTRRARLLAMKLTALARDHGVTDAELVPADLGFAAAVRAGDACWLLADGDEGDPARALGGAVAWTLRSGATELNLLADRGTGTLARRAEAFRLAIRVWHVEGRVLLPAVAEPLPDPVAVPAEHESLRELIAAGGATPVVEHGVLAGEVAGLEVCRAVTDPVTGATRLEVGIGAHDREAFQMLHGDRPTRESLAEVVSVVAPHRSPGAPGHPLNRLARSRALRAALVNAPHLVGASVVEPLAPPIPRGNLKDELPCLASAVIDGNDVLLVCSSGVDLDVVPFAVDARVAARLDRCAIVVPRRDDLEIQHRVADALVVPIGILPVDTGKPAAP